MICEEYNRKKIINKHICKQNTGFMIQISPLCILTMETSLHQPNHMLFIIRLSRKHKHHRDSHMNTKKCSISFDTFIKMCGLPCVKFFRCRQTPRFVHLFVLRNISSPTHTLTRTY